MTDQAPELLPCPFCDTPPRLIDGTANDVGYFVRCEYCRLDYPQAVLNSAEKAIAIWNTRPTPAERPVPQVREAWWSFVEMLDARIEGKTKCSISAEEWTKTSATIRDALAALTARPSDAAVAWWKILADNWRGRNGNSTTGDSVRNSCADELEKVAKRHAALPPDEPARVSGLTIEHRLQAVRATAIEECAKIAETTRWDNPSRIASDIRALAPARVTPSTVGGEALKANLREAWSALALIRETIETLGPIGAMQASEHLDGPTFMHEADAIVRGIRLLAESPTIASEKEPVQADSAALAHRSGT